MKIGIIGVGNMGGVIASSLIKNGYSLNLSSVKNISKELKGDYEEMGNIEIAKNSDYIFLGVKPHIYPVVIEEIKPYLKDQVIISIAAGMSIDKLNDMIGSDKKIVMTMPNTPAMVGEGMAAITRNENVSDEEISEVEKMFNSFGKSLVVPSDTDFNGLGVAVGCLPAYVYMFIEALADAAVYSGVKRDEAYLIASQNVLGAAKMVLETGKHPGELKDMVTSPGGTTIAGVKSLEENGFRGTVIEAITDAVDKSKNM